MTIVPAWGLGQCICIYSMKLLWNIAFACNIILLDEIKLHLPRMHCKSEALAKMVPKFWNIFCG